VNNYLNIKEENLDFYFWIALVVSKGSLLMEFAKTFFLLLLQAKGVFLQSARDGVGCGCGLPYRMAPQCFDSFALLCNNNETTAFQNLIQAYWMLI
jgi:hypothetical protein